MTYSILAYDSATGAFGAAVASRFFAVGALCLHSEGRVGALSTQALINPMYGPDGMNLLRQGVPAQDVVDQLVQPDPGRDQRQLHVIDARGCIAQHTGPGCVGWAGQRRGIGVSVAGNMLAEPGVVDAMIEAYGTSGSLALRLIAALQAGEAAGGDKRGRQSAALCIHTRDPYPDLDLRVDDHPNPLAELRRLHRVSLERFAVLRPLMAGRDNPWGVIDRATIEDAVTRHGQSLP